MPPVTNPNLISILNKQAQPLQPANTNTPAGPAAPPLQMVVPPTADVPTNYEPDPDNPGRVRPIAGGPADESVNDIDDSTATFYAQQLLAGGQMPPLGMGKAAANARRKIMEKVAEQAGAKGLTGEDLARQVAHYKAGSKQIATLETQLGTIRQNEETALLNGQQFIDRSAELPGQTGFPVLNSIVQGVQRNAPVPGHDTIAAMDAAYNTFYTEYAKVVAGSPSGSGVLSDSARQEAMETIRSNASMAQKRAAFEQMKKDMENRIQAIHAGINEAYQNLTQQPGYQVPETTSGLVPLAVDSSSQNGRPASLADKLATEEVTPEQKQQWQSFMSGLKQGEATPEQLDGAWRAITGRPLINAKDYADRFNKTGEFDLGVSYERPDISDRRGGGGAAESLDAGVRSAADTATAGLASVVSAAADAATSDRSFNESLDREAAISDYDWQQHAIASGVGTVGGALLVPSRATFAARAAARAALRSGAGREAAVVAARRAAAKQLMKEGAAYGAVHGAATSRGDAADTIAQSAVEAATGAGTGRALPYVAQAAGAATRAVKSVFQRTPDLAKKVIFKAIKADGNTADDLSRQAADADANGVPYMIGDSGENARGLMSASARAPGPGRTKAIDALDDRQGALADRVVSHIERDLGPIANPHKVADDLMTQASDAAGPLYEAAYAKSGAGAFASKIEPLLTRPSMKKAFAKAYRIAQEEGRDPTTLGFDIDQAGEVTLKRVPSWQTLDYVKRGMDDVVEAYRDPTSGRLNLDTEGRAINNTLRTFVKAFDKANPDYAAARNAYGGPVRGVNAMNDGRKALNMTADDLEERMRGMTDYEREMFALGARRAMAELVESKGDTANVVHALVGTGKKRAMLARLFGDKAGFDRFVKTLDMENEAHQTFKRARTGSPTAPNHQDDSALAVATGVADLATSGMPIISALRIAARAKDGTQARRAQDAIASMLGESDPAKVRELIRKFRREEARLMARRKRDGLALPMAVKAVPNTAQNDD